MKILLLYIDEVWQPEVQLFKKAAGQHKIAVAHASDVIVKKDSANLTIKVKNKDILCYDAVCLFTAAFKMAITFTIAAYLKSQGKIVINSSLAEDKSFGNKIRFLERAQQFKLPHPKTYLIDAKKNIPQVVKSLGLPIIVKRSTGLHGTSVRLFKTASEVKKFFKKEPIYRYIFQQYIPVKEDTRVLCIGYQVIGAMVRRASKKDFRSNLHIGGSAEAVELTPELKRLAEKAARAAQAEVAGVDILTHKGRRCVLEVNHYPGIAGFHKATGINPAEYIIKYIEREARKKK